MEQKLIKVFLDDIRDPYVCSTYMHQRIGAFNPLYLGKWEVVRNYTDFVNLITSTIENGDVISHISFDHDLGEDIAQLAREDGMSKRQARKAKKEVKSGHDCAKWLEKYYVDNDIKFPIIFVHSQNPVGVENIRNVFK